MVLGGSRSDRSGDAWFGSRPGAATTEPASATAPGVGKPPGLRLLPTSGHATQPRVGTSNLAGRVGGPPRAERRRGCLGAKQRSSPLVCGACCADSDDMSRRRAVIAVAVGSGLLAGGTVAPAAPTSRPARTPAAASSSVATGEREPFARPCALLTTREIERALGRRYTPDRPLDGWLRLSQSLMDANDPLYQFNRAYVQLAAAVCSWSSGQTVNLGYSLRVYRVPVSQADLARADASWASRHHESLIPFAAVGDLGRWAGFAFDRGTSIVRVAVGRALVTLLDYDHSRTAQRPPALHLARILLRRLSASPGAGP